VGAVLPGCVGFDYRSKIHDARWRSTWDWGLFIGGSVPPLIFGVAFGNLLQGAPFQFDDYMASTHTGSFWKLLNPFALLAGVVSSAMITMHGVVITSTVIPASLADPLAKTVVRDAGAWWLNYHKQPILWLLPVLGVGGALLAMGLVRARRTLLAFIASALAIAGVIGTAGAAMFPFVMPSSTMPNASLTVWDSVSSPMTLGLMFWATLIFMPLIIFYTGWAYRVRRGKVTVAHISANEHTAY
jgi:cytochrome d ubiquinol oxidase subunit II